MNHYCTYFDRGFLLQGLALWRSLSRHDSEAVLWVLALDDFTAGLLRQLGESRLRVVTLAEFEEHDAELAAAKLNRTAVDYVFTLSPCWSRWLLAHRSDIERVTYLDADLFFFASPRAVFAAMDAARASVLVTAHRFPPWLRHYERHGRFNVGILSFRRDAAGLACLSSWRESCLNWCHDRVEGDRYADQRYLDAWPAQLGSSLLILDHPGVNLAPWNWEGVTRESGAAQPEADLVAFHFARLRPLGGTRWWRSGQLDYGIMPWTLRRKIYGAYWLALEQARLEITALRADFAGLSHPPRSGRAAWRELPLRLVFGGDWLRVGRCFFNLRFGLGRWSGRTLGLLRRLRLFVDRPA